MKQNSLVKWHALLFVVTAVLGAHAGAAAEGAPKVARHSMPDDFSGTWAHDMMAGVNPGRARPDDKVFTMTDGTVIPLLPRAEKLYRERVAMGMTDHAYANTSSRCLPIGTPGNMMGAPYPVQIVQRPEFMAILFEEGWQFRTVYMNRKHPDELIPSFMGHSIGHWEGKTLVIDTVSMREETTLNSVGLPHSAEMHVVERIKRLAPDRLEDVIEITDPQTYSKPFAFTSIFNKSDEDLIEYICENSKVEVTPDGRQSYADSPK
ncbi:MAG: hypothetical protein M3N50_14155 [Pseudomonadota bacterium]|nr:hypothetical protein [Pseudomonadota bacterium]